MIDKQNRELLTARYYILHTASYSFLDGIALADLHKSISKATFLVFLTAAARAKIISPAIMHHLQSPVSLLRNVSIPQKV